MKYWSYITRDELLDFVYSKQGTHELDSQSSSRILAEFATMHRLPLRQVQDDYFKLMAEQKRIMARLENAVEEAKQKGPYKANLIKSSVNSGFGKRYEVWEQMLLELTMLAMKGKPKKSMARYLNGIMPHRSVHSLLNAIYRMKPVKQGEKKAQNPKDIEPISRAAGDNISVDQLRLLRSMEGSKELALCPTTVPENTPAGAAAGEDVKTASAAQLMLDLESTIAKVEEGLSALRKIRHQLVARENENIEFQKVKLALARMG